MSRNDDVRSPVRKTSHLPSWLRNPLYGSTAALRTTPVCSLPSAAIHLSLVPLDSIER